jgi:hypothetical protein
MMGGGMTAQHVEKHAQPVSRAPGPKKLPMSAEHACRTGDPQ